MFLRSLLFSLVMILMTVITAILVLIISPLPFKYISKFLCWYAATIVGSLKLLCGIDYSIEGIEHIPQHPFLIFSKHQSTWETLTLQLIFAPICFVLKNELLWVPFFGWGLAAMKPIAIKRGTGQQAIRQIVKKGKVRLEENISIVIFPEGTRTKPGGPGKYRIGGAVLAAESGALIVPVAHNAGEFWRRKGFLKKPGNITVRIGPVIQTKGKTPEAILAEVKMWIETTMLEISTVPYKFDTNSNK